MTKGISFEIDSNPREKDIQFVKGELKKFEDSLLPPGNQREIHIVGFKNKVT
jgi:hypothetical protein